MYIVNTITMNPACGRAKLGGFAGVELQKWPKCDSKEPDGYLPNEHHVFGLNVPGNSHNTEAPAFFEVTFSKNPSVYTRLCPCRSVWVLWKSARVVPPPGTFPCFLS